MIEKLEKFQILSLGIILAISLVISTKMIASSVSKNVISVTGSAYEIVKSDIGTLDFEITVKSATKKNANNISKGQLKTVEEYLKNKKIENIEIKTTNGYYNYQRDPKTGNYTNIPESYTLTQPISISSNNVNLIKDVSTDITNLINEGIDINVFTPSYGYSNFGNLKITLLEKASKDAQQRASSMLKPTGNKVDKINSVRMGVFQITPVNSTDVSDMGISDTSTIDKKVTAVVNASFKIK